MKEHLPKSAKGTVRGVESGGHKARASGSSPPMRCDKTCQVSSTRCTNERLGARGSSRGLATCAPPSGTCPNARGPGGKRCSTGTARRAPFRLRRLPSSAPRVPGALPESQVPGAGGRPPRKQAFPGTLLHAGPSQRPPTERGPRSLRKMAPDVELAKCEGRVFKHVRPPKTYRSFFLS